MLKTKKRVNSEYQFVRCLGEGLTSVVYEALRSNSSGISNERVAVKVLKSKNSVSWLQKEFESLRKVNSPHCVRVLGHESFDESAALILEFIEGVSLFELGSRFKLTSDEIYQIENDVLLGLNAISITGGAHGDLNPKNILINKEGRVQLIDFGSFSAEEKLVGAAPYLSAVGWNRGSKNFESDLQSWFLIRKDLNEQFMSVPSSPEACRERAQSFAAGSGPKLLVSGINSNTSAELAEKVCAILKEKQQLFHTTVLEADSPRVDSFCSVKMILKMAALAALVLFPTQNLLSEPLKTAVPGALLVRTREWTELTVNGRLLGFAPLTLQKLEPGEYRIKYKRSHGSGELVLRLNAGQKRLLKDADFIR